MTVRMKIEFDYTADGVAQALDALGALSAGPEAPVEGVETAQKPRRGRKSKMVDVTGEMIVAPVKEQFVNPPTTEPMLVIPGTAPGSDPLASLGASAQLPPVATVTPAAPVNLNLQQALTQQHLIQAFTALAKTPGKGPDAMRAVLTGLGVATVGAIPQAQWPAAIDAVRKAIG